MNRTQTLAIVIFAGLMIPCLDAQEAGDTVAFVVPEGTEISILGSEEPGDKLIFVGRSSETTDGGSCAPGSGYHIQSVVIVDPRAGGTRATRRLQVITTSQTTPVPPGTRVTDIAINTQCEIAGVIFDRYIGTVE